MRKTVLAPVFQLDCPSRGEGGFVEMVVEPQYTRPARPWFHPLQGLGLDAALQLAQRALAKRRPLPITVAVYWTNPTLPLSHTEGMALALALGVCVMHAPGPYSEIIVAGRLRLREAAGGRSATIEDNGYLTPSLAAIATLGARPRPSCLILPSNPPASPEQQTLLARIDRLGIDVYRVGTLDTAIAACLAVEAGKVERP